jgi:hypothetical protein
MSLNMPGSIRSLKLTGRLGQALIGRTIVNSQCIYPLFQDSITHKRYAYSTSMGAFLWRWLGL